MSLLGLRAISPLLFLAVPPFYAYAIIMILDIVDKDKTYDSNSSGDSIRCRLILIPKSIYT